MLEFENLCIIFTIVDNQFKIPMSGDDQQPLQVAQTKPKKVMQSIAQLRAKKSQSPIPLSTKKSRFWGWIVRHL